jgi:hypothetical protein
MIIPEEKRYQLFQDYLSLKNQLQLFSQEIQNIASIVQNEMDLKGEDILKLYKQHLLIEEKLQEFRGFSNQIYAKIYTEVMRECLKDLINE